MASKGPGGEKQQSMNPDLDLSSEKDPFIKKECLNGNKISKWNREEKKTLTYGVRQWAKMSFLAVEKAGESSLKNS